MKQVSVFVQFCKQKSNGLIVDARTQIEAFASQYFPEALDFITAPHRDGERWESYTHSTEFDYESIMLYPSSKFAVCLVRRN